MKIGWWETVGHVKYVEKHFKLKKILKFHSDSVHSTQTFPCIKCPKTFKRKDVLKIHLEKYRSKHFGERVEISRNKKIVLLLQKNLLLNYPISFEIKWCQKILDTTCSYSKL